MRTGKTELHRQRVAHVYQDRQREAGLLMGMRRTKPNAAACALFQSLGDRVVFKHQNVVEQRLAAVPGPALDIVQAGVLMLAQGQVLRLHRLQPVRHRPLGIHRADHRQGVDEQADLLFHTRQVRRAPGHGGAERHHRLASVTMQQNQPGGLDQSIEGDLLTARESFKARG